MNPIRNISIIGSGLAASFFARVFHSKGFKIQYIISRNPISGKQLSIDVGADFSDDFSMERSSDLTLICVNDTAITDIVQKLKIENDIVAHCAGSVSLDALNRFNRHAVIYPLQSLAGQPDSSVVPILFETNHSEDLHPIRQFLNDSGFVCREVNSDKRLRFHLAAVFANNFSNAILDATHQLSVQEELDFELLKPLIEKTFISVIKGGIPKDLQTGPAKRNDLLVLESHQALLEKNPDLLKLYRMLSDFIGSRHNVRD